MKYAGACHCGAIRFEFETARVPSEWAVRCCTCSFCRRHRPRYVSDPAGTVRFQIDEPEQVGSYRFGTGTADFMTCKRCATFVAAIHRKDSSCWCVVNINALQNEPAELAPSKDVSFEEESGQERQQRREQRWTPVAGELKASPTP